MTRIVESASEWTRCAPPRMLRAAEERVAPAAWAARVEVALEEHRLLGLSRDEEMTEVCVTNIADNVKPRVAVDSVEVSSRMEGVPPSRNRGSGQVKFLRTRCWSMQTGRKCTSP